MTIKIAKNDLHDLIHPRFVSWSLSLMGIYAILTVLLPNYSLIATILGSHESFFSKLAFLQSMITGSFISYSGSELVILLLTGLLIGMNLSLWLSRKRSALTTVPLLSGQSLAGVISSGCSSCGSTILSVISAGLGIGILPIHLLLIQLGTILFLGFSFIYSLQKQSSCPIPSQS